MILGVTLLGVPIDDVSMEETLERIDSFIAEGSFHQIATANIDYLVQATKDPEHRHTLCMCDLVVADGMPIVWISRLFGAPLKERVTGADLVPRLARLSSEKKYGIFLLGAQAKVSEGAALRLKSIYPGVRIVGRLSPPVLPIDEFDDDAIIREIEQANPHILLVAFGSPKQEKWINRNRHRLRVPVCIGVGGSLDFLAGAVPRAPRWMQQSGLEWLYRIWAEPRRLAGRYVIDAVWMMRYLTVQLAVSVAARRNGGALQIAVESLGSVNIIRVSGLMTGSRLVRLEQSAAVVTERGGALVLDLTAVSYLGADGLRMLAGLSRAAKNRSGEIWLSGLTPALIRTLRSAHLDGLFCSAPSALDAVRQVSGGRLQLNLELGEGWAVCRIGGRIPEGAHFTLDEICRRVLETNEHFEFDASGVPEFNPSGLLRPTLSRCRVVFVDSSRTTAAGAA